MDHFSFLLLLSLVLPAACYFNPATFGFIYNGNGEYSKAMTTTFGTPYTLKMKIYPDRHAEFRSDEIDLRQFWPGNIPMNGWELPSDMVMAGSGGLSRTQSTGPVPPLRWPLDPGMIKQMVENQRAQQYAELNGVQNTPSLMNQNVRNNELNQYGPFYKVLWKKLEIDGKCRQTIAIQGHPEKATALINANFVTTCNEEYTSLMYCVGDEVLVGGIDRTDLVVYGHKDIPARLIVVKGRVSRLYTYTKDGPWATDLDLEGSEKVQVLLKNIQDEFAKEPQKRQGGNLKEKQQELNNLVKAWIDSGYKSTSGARVKPISPNNPTGTPVNSHITGTDPPTSTNKPTVAPKKKHWLRRCWIYIKNICRKVTGRPTKDE